MTTFFSMLVLVASSLLLGAADVVPRLHNEYDPEKWPEAELKLSQAATLKDIFDSGFRPYRHPGLENSLLELKHLNLSIYLGSGMALPPLQLELINITPFRDAEIATIEGFTPKLTLEQARVVMLKLLPYGENRRTENDLNDYLEAVKDDYLDFDDPYRGVPHGCGISWNEPGFKTLGGGPRCGFGFRKTASSTHPLRLHFGLRWGLNRPSKDRGSYRPHPIKPPLGYEDVDMTAPEKFGPDNAVDILRSKDVDIGEQAKAREKNQSREDYSMNKKPKEGFRTPVREKKTNRLPWIIAGVLLAGVLALFFKLIKGKSTS